MPAAAAPATSAASLVYSSCWSHVFSPVTWETKLSSAVPWPMSLFYLHIESVAGCIPMAGKLFPRCFRHLWLSSFCLGCWDVWAYYGVLSHDLFFIPFVCFLEVGSRFVDHADLTLMVPLSLPLKCYHRCVPPPSFLLGGLKPYLYFLISEMCVL